MTPATRLLLLCHPHNPVGRVWRADELAKLAEFCQRHDLYVCSDEIHCDLILDADTRHTPLALAHPELASRCMTLMAPSKTYNIPGLGCSFAVIQDPALRARFAEAMHGIVPDVNVLGLVAAEAAYREVDILFDEAEADSPARVLIVGTGACAPDAIVSNRRLPPSPDCPPRTLRRPTWPGSTRAA